MEHVNSTNSTELSINSLACRSIKAPSSRPALKQMAGLRQARVAHYHILGLDTGRNYVGRRITKKNPKQSYFETNL